MKEPDYPALSAKLFENGQALCERCGLTVLRRARKTKLQKFACPSTCPAQVARASAQLILRDYTPDS